MKRVRGFLTGFTAGVFLMFGVYFFVFVKIEDKSFEYIKLKEDFHIDNVGTLKKGTIMRIDEPMSEGFTRYILYLNLKGDGTEIYETDKDKDYLIIPYWLQPEKSIK